MTLVKSMGRVTQTGQLQIPPHILRLVGAKPGQHVEFVIGPRDMIQVKLKNLRVPKPRPKNPFYHTDPKPKRIR